MLAAGQGPEFSNI
uniref:Uncharacterized protein n=1 Tax=Anguilla anguilla TaxID=7936 RepID=A0A0E9V3H1_ANGAN